tara:strand:+ start:1042 stop:1152 length:111 start_codon:yes stop_codon:yes gene_type:complete
MDIPIFYDFIYIIRSFAEIVLIYFGVKALQTYMRRL